MLVRCLVLASIVCANVCNFYAKNALDIANHAQWRTLQTASCFEKIKNEANARCICLVVGSFRFGHARREQQESIALRKCDSPRDVLSTAQGRFASFPSAAAPFGSATALRAFDTERTDDSCASILSLQYSVCVCILAEIPRTVNFRAVKRWRPGCWFFVRFNKNSTGSSPRRSAP